MTPTEPGFNADELRIIAVAAAWRRTYAAVAPASILALLAEVERLRQVAESDRQTAQDYADEVVAAHVERDSLRARLGAVDSPEIAYKVAKVLWDRAEAEYWDSERDYRQFDPNITEILGDNVHRGAEWLGIVMEVLTELSTALAEGGGE